MHVGFPPSSEKVERTRMCEKGGEGGKRVRGFLYLLYLLFSFLMGCRVGADAVDFLC